MHYYKTTVRLSGSTMNEVVKVLSAPEILVLQFIHGTDSITKVSKVKEKDIDVREEKERLKSVYDQALIKREQSIDKIFGPLGSVVTELPGDLLAQFGIDDSDEDDIISVAKNTTQIDKSGRLPQNQTEANNIDKIVSQDEIDLNDIAG